MAQLNVKTGFSSSMGTILTSTSMTLGEDYVKLAQSFVNVY